MKDLIEFGRAQARIIGAHYRLIGTPNLTNEAYEEARRKSDEAVALVKYLIQQLENRHFAVTLASAAGMQGYINLR